MASESRSGQLEFQLQCERELRIDGVVQGKYIYTKRFLGVHPRPLIVARLQFLLGKEAMGKKKKHFCCEGAKGGPRSLNELYSPGAQIRLGNFLHPKKSGGSRRRASKEDTPVKCKGLWKGPMPRRGPFASGGP